MSDVYRYILQNLSSYNCDPYILITVRIKVYDNLIATTKGPGLNRLLSVCFIVSIFNNNINTTTSHGMNISHIARSSPCRR